MIREKEASRTAIVICQATFDSLWVYHQKFQIMPMPVGLKELKVQLSVALGMLCNTAAFGVNWLPRLAAVHFPELLLHSRHHDQVPVLQSVDQLQCPPGPSQKWTIPNPSHGSALALSLGESNRKAYLCWQEEEPWDLEGTNFLGGGRSPS